MVEAFVISRARILALFLALAVGIGILAVVPATSAAQDSQSPPPEVVVLARSDNPADALGAGPVAGILGAPVLVTPTALLLPSVAASIEAIDPDLVILAGGTAALSADVEAAVNDLGYATRRAAGSDRHETAVQIAGLLAEYNTGRPLLSGTPISDQVIPGLNAEQLGGMTITDVLEAIEDGQLEETDQLGGELLITVGPGGWDLIDTDQADEVRLEREPHQTRVSANDGGGAGLVGFTVPVAIPRTISDRPVTLHGMEFCYGATSQSKLSVVALRVTGPSGSGFTWEAVHFDDTERTGNHCREYMFDDPHVLAERESVHIVAGAQLDTPSYFDLRHATLIMSVDD